LQFDPIQFKNDQQNSVNEDFNLDEIYQNFQIAMRMERIDSALKHALDKIKSICQEKGGRSFEQVTNPLVSAYNLSFNSPEYERFVHCEEKINYHSLFVTQEEFDDKFKNNKDIPEFMKLGVEFKGKVHSLIF